jgi:ribosome-associated heat shock protein Hsp15
MAEAAPSIRLDKWLWHARFCKSRAIAARLVSDGAVRLNAARVLKPATPVRVGDGLSFALGGRVRVVRVRALGTRRGPAPEAQCLYDDLEAPATPSSADHAATPALEPDPEADR